MVAYNLAKGLAIRILDSISNEGWPAEWMDWAKLSFLSVFK
jgi:hypothetical protein